MKLFQEDSEFFERRSIETAWIEDPKERFLELDNLFGDCGTAAESYLLPAEVLAQFVHAVAETFTETCLAKKGMTA